ncbi:MAG TPA: NAD(P)H-binding protein [Nocardioidaceae bacterium]
MKIALYGASGMIGSRIAVEALSRDHAVTGLTRSGSIDVPPGCMPRRGDAADADDVARIASEHDVVISAIGPSRTGVRHEVFLHALATLAEQVARRRLIVVGGSGSLYVAPGLRLMDSPGFPPAAKPEQLTQATALELLKDTGALADWVYVSPAPFIAPGERRGHYRRGRDMVLGDQISAEDFALAIVDEVEQPKFHRSRFTVAW